MPEARAAGPVAPHAAASPAARTPTSIRRSWNVVLKRSSRQVAVGRRAGGRGSRAPSERVVVDRERAPADLHAPEQEAVAGQHGVQAPSRLAQRREALVPAASPTPAQTAAMSLRWLHSRSSSSSSVRARATRAWIAAPAALGGVRVGDAVRDRAGRARARRIRERLLERHAGRGALQAAVLVEEAGVEVEDAVADDVEAEVARLDDPRVDRADRDLVGVVPATGTVQRARSGV